MIPIPGSVIRVNFPQSAVDGAVRFKYCLPAGPNPHNLGRKNAMSMPHTNSLYTLVMVDAVRAEKDKTGETTARLNSQLSHFNTNYAAEKLSSPYEQVTISTDELIDRIYTPGRVLEEKRRQILGKMTKTEFVEQFGAGRKRFHSAITANGASLLGVFKNKSFPETYFHPDIARALCGTGLLTKEATAETRIMHTAAVVLNTLDEDNALAKMLGMAESHKRKRSKLLYKEDTVEFTLLTFSYFGAKPSEIREADWFFFWRVFGSMMGLGPERLHQSYDQAKQRMHLLHTQCPMPPTALSGKLLAVHVKTVLGNDDDIKEACECGWVSKKMEQYLRLVGKWPATLVNRKDV